MKIFLSVGTQKFPFDRLVKMVDRAVNDHASIYTAYGQTGYSTYTPVSFKSKPFLQRDEFDSLIRDSDLIITHGGVSTIVTGLKYKKKIIVVPRLQKYGEHVDDHQKQICDAFGEKGFVLTVNDGDDIWEAIQKSEHFHFQPYISHRLDMINMIENFIEQNRA